MKTLLNILGTIILITSIVVGIYIMSTLKYEVTFMTTSFEAKNPLRYYYGGGIILGGLIQASVLYALVIIIKNTEKPFSTAGVS